MADTYNDNVVCALHFNGTNGATSTIDEAKTTRTWTFNGNAALSTAVVKYGSASLALDGSGDYLSMAVVDAEFNFESDFTIEAWIYRTSGTNNYQSIFATGQASFILGCLFFMTYGSSAPVSAQRDKVAFGGQASNPLLISTSNLANNTWTHVAVTRQGTTFRLFVAGVLEATASSVSITGNMTQDWARVNDLTTRIGSNGWDGAAGYFTGYIDDFRITKGVARYTATFTPPAAEFEYTAPDAIRATGMEVGAILIPGSYAGGRRRQSAVVN